MPLLDPARIWPTIIVGDTGNRVPRLAQALAAAAAADVAQTLLNERSTHAENPFSHTDGWRSQGLSTCRFEFEFGGEDVQAGLTYLHDGALSFKVGDTAGVLSFSATKQGIDLQFAGQRALVNV